MQQNEIQADVPRRQVSKKLIAIGALALVITAGAAGWGGSYLATRQVATPSPSAGPVSGGPAATVTASATPSVSTSLAAASTALAPTSQPPVATPKPTASSKSTVSSKSTGAPQATSKPPATTSAPRGTTPSTPTCVYDETWAARQERNRISREAERANMNIRINMAINSGDLDEAAMLQNNMMAMEQQWALDDQQDPEPTC